jgi:hypothetical protein
MVRERHEEGRTKNKLKKEGETGGALGSVVL